MKIKIVIPSKVYPTDINIGMALRLKKCVSGFDDCTLVESSEDVVHIFGKWDIWTSRQIVRYSSRGIPVVYSGIDGNASLYNHNGKFTYNPVTRYSLQKVAKSGAVIQVGGNIEFEALRHIAHDAISRIIYNPDTTSLTDNTQMVSQFVQLYNEAIRTTDIKIRTNIGHTVKKHIEKELCCDETEYSKIVDLCSRILYMRHLYVKGAIPQQFLNDTAAIMTQYNYNERLFAKVINRLHATSFASHAMGCLNEAASLTEGFMPIKPSYGKTADKMLMTIVQ